MGMSDLDPVITNYDLVVDPDNYADGKTTDALDVPQKDLPPEAFDEEAKSPMVDDTTT